MAKRKGQVVLSQLVTSDDRIKIAIVDVNDVGGGRHIVDTLADRLTIPEKHRKEGMIVYVKADDTDYKLKAGYPATGNLSAEDFEVYAPGLPEGVLTAHQKVEDIEFDDTTDYAKLTDKLDAMDQAIEDAASAQNVEDLTWETAPVGDGRSSSLSTEINTLFTKTETNASGITAINGVLNDPNEIVVGTEEVGGETVDVSLATKLTRIDDAITEAGVAQNIEDISWGETPLGDTRHAALSTELNTLFNQTSTNAGAITDINNVLNRPENIVVGTEEVGGETVDVSLATKLSRIDTAVGTNTTDIATINGVLNDPDEIVVGTEAIGGGDISLTTKLNRIDADLTEALQKVNVNPIITNFVISTDTFETGSTVSSLEIKFNLNKPVSEAVLKDGATTVANIKTILGGDTVPAEATVTVTGLTITANTTLTLEVTDDQNQSTTKTADVKFAYKLLYGAIAQGTTIDQAALESLTASQVMENPFGKYVRINCGDGTTDKVPALAIVSSAGVSDDQITFINGYYSSWTKSTVSFTNASGGTANYDVFVFDDPVIGNVIATIVDLI